MFSPVLRTLVVSVLLLGTSDFCDAQSDLDAIEKEIEAFSASREKNRESARARELKRVEDAAKSPTSASLAYADAYRQIELAGKTGQGADFAEWKSKNSEWLGGLDFGTAAQLHLTYLALTMRRAGSDKPGDFARPSMDYVRKFGEADLGRFQKQAKIPQEQRQLLDGNVTTGIFARAWKLAPYLTGLKDWAMSPGKPEEILDRNVRAPLAKAADRAILDSWLWQISYETDRMKGNRSSHAREEFENLRLPDLEFRRVRSMAAIGDFPGAIKSGFGVARQNPEHPEFENWIKDIRDWLAKARGASGIVAPPDTLPINPPTPAG